MNLTAVTNALQSSSGQVPGDMAAAVAQQLATLQHSKDMLWRTKLRRAGWALIAGGPLMAATLGISASVLENVSHWLARFVASFSGFGGLMFFAGIVLLVYVRMAFKNEPLPQVVVLPAPQLGMTGQLPLHPMPTPSVETPYRSAFPAPATVAQPPSVTESTTELLNDPHQLTPKVQ
ncbi:MAG: hypothetical protein SNJ67_00795 [Chloracidobacterium sp.]|uniref:Uncharacterized protein n=1 Tax=Chloracidobacterium validum TaxID=2821543 RepID=A0ABX8B659_9BACT|nr:hypothetical protein [Chloracidobacterium validum]QUW02403.1 hypothetical protein J8C06_08565 [Chloracidobacterium validum]